MWPTSIAVWNCSAPPQCGAAVALLRRPDVGEARLEVAAVLDAAQVPAGPVRAGDELALAQQLVGDDLAVEADRPERAGGRRRTRARISSSVAGRAFSPSAASSFASSSRSSPRTSASTTVPSSFVYGIAFDVAASSMSSSCASASIVVVSGVSISSGAVERLREGRRARDRARDLDVGRVVAVLARDERVLAGARRREVVERLAAAHHPRLGLRRRTSSGRSARRCARRRRGSSRSSRRGRPRRGRASTSPS